MGGILAVYDAQFVWGLGFGQNGLASQLDVSLSVMSGDVSLSVMSGDVSLS